MHPGNFTRGHLGKLFSEGSRLLWIKFLASGLSLSRYAAQIGGIDGPQLGRYLYGDRKPTLSSALKIKAAAGIEPSDWEREPTEAFDVPSRRSTIPAETAAVA